MIQILATYVNVLKTFIVAPPTSVITTWALLGTIQYVCMYPGCYLVQYGKLLKLPLTL